MKHICNLPSPKLEDFVDLIRSFSWVHTHASEVSAAHVLPPDQPILCWNTGCGGSLMNGDPDIHSTLVVMPIDACPFCVEWLTKRRQKPNQI